MGQEQWFACKNSNNREQKLVFPEINEKNSRKNIHKNLSQKFQEKCQQKISSKNARGVYR